MLLAMNYLDMGWVNLSTEMNKVKFPMRQLTLLMENSSNPVMRRVKTGTVNSVLYLQATRSAVLMLVPFTSALFQKFTHFLAIMILTHKVFRLCFGST